MTTITTEIIQIEGTTTIRIGIRIETTTRGETTREIIIILRESMKIELLFLRPK